MKRKYFVLPSDELYRELRDLDQNVVIVSIFGNSPLGEQNLAYKLLDLNTPDNNDDIYHGRISIKIPFYIEGWYDESEKIVFLCLKGPFDGLMVKETFKVYSNELKSEGFLPVWSRLRVQYAEALMFIFTVSHIVILSHPSHCLDMTFIQLFKSLSLMRSKYQTVVSNAMKVLRLENEELMQHGRFCCPRILFLFAQCPSLDRSFRKLHVIKTLEHALEDQIYSVLRRTRLVKNLSDQACFSIAPNDEFVYVYYDQERDEDLSLLSLITSDCISSEESGKSESEEESDAGFDSSYYNENNFGNSDSDSDDTLSETFSSNRNRHSFKEFVMNHVHTAHRKGFFDNMGKYAISKPFFMLPTLLEWLKIANYLLCEIQSGQYTINSGQQLLMEKLLNVDLRFSNTRCAKVMPLAIVAYQDNLPPHYTAKFHQDKVDHAISVFTRQARGPEMSKFILQLKEECDRFWKSGRQMCEILSLTGNPCTKPMHVVTNTQSSQLSESDHWSGVCYMSSCNCGVRQGTRPDPFTIRAANFEFYLTTGEECGCVLLERINFPIFQPSIHNFRAAELFNFSPPPGNGLQSSSNDLRASNGSVQTLSIAKLWGPENSALGMISVTPHSNFTDNIDLVLQSDHPDRPLVRQASTTEYLPSMLHTESPMGLLPQFPSWSLICRGPSSLYSHNIGLQDQPSFIAGSAYLLPWDVTIRQKERCWPSISETPRRIPNIGRGSGYRKFRGPRELFSVKIFVGVEYECLRGHRFMSSGPGKVLKATGNGLVKENATKVTKGNMPLYMQCPCGKAVAQLMRVHIVTPKAPVFVTVNPRIRPAPPPCPIFVTGAQKPTPLSQSAYWVLRLPYIYAGERETYKIPEDSSQIAYGELLAPMYGITEPK